MKVSQDAHKVSEAEDDELVMSSEYNMFKIAKRGVVTATKGVNDSENVTEVEHGLGYKPVVLASWVGAYNLPMTEYFSAGTLGVHVDVIDIGTNNFYIRIKTASSGSYYSNALSYQIYYYVLLETGTPA